MRLNSTRVAAPLALAALSIAGGCRGASADATASDALKRDLELAQASAVALAPRVPDLPATRFVSALEAGERPAAGAGRAARPARRAPSRAPAAHADHAPPAPTPVAVSEAEATAASEPAPAPAAAAPVVAEDAGPAPERTEHGGPSDGVITVAAPSEGNGSTGTDEGRRGRGRGIGGAIGGLIGVVIRGGGVGDVDHCERDRPGARGRMPVGGGGFPVGVFNPGSGGSIGVPQSGVGRVGRPRY